MASDGCNLHALFRAPNGDPLYIDVQLTAAMDVMRARAVMFCDTCWLHFLEDFARRAEMKRLIDV